jgi:hypothetical protein
MSDPSVGLTNSENFGTSARITSFAAISLAALSLIAISKAGIVSLFSAWSRPEYSHGYIIPLFSVPVL